MTRTELAAGSAVFLAITVAGFVSTAWVDRHFAHESTQTPTAACVGEDGSWKNWVWANVPALSPNCAPSR
jgi:hypothetical protein